MANDKYGHLLEERHCDYCGNMYLAMSCSVRKGTAKFCGRSCKTKAEMDRENRSGLTRKERMRVYYKFRRAVKLGRMIRPTTCSECGREAEIDGHHSDYTKPFCVEWLCRKCHTKRHL